MQCGWKDGDVSFAPGVDCTAGSGGGHHNAQVAGGQQLAPALPTAPSPGPVGDAAWLAPAELLPWLLCLASPLPHAVSMTCQNPKTPLSEADHSRRLDILQCVEKKGRCLEHIVISVSQVSYEVKHLLVVNKEQAKLPNQSCAAGLAETQVGHVGQRSGVSPASDHIAAGSTLGC